MKKVCFINMIATLFAFLCFIGPVFAGITINISEHTPNESVTMQIEVEDTDTFEQIFNKIASKYPDFAKRFEKEKEQLQFFSVNNNNGIQSQPIPFTQTFQSQKNALELGKKYMKNEIDLYFVESTVFEFYKTTRNDVIHNFEFRQWLHFEKTAASKKHDNETVQYYYERMFDQYAVIQREINWFLPGGAGASWFPTYIDRIKVYKQKSDKLFKEFLNTFTNESPEVRKAVYGELSNTHLPSQEMRKTAQDCLLESESGKKDVNLEYSVKESLPYFDFLKQIFGELVPSEDVEFFNKIKIFLQQKPIDVVIALGNTALASHNNLQKITVRVHPEDTYAQVLEKIKVIFPSIDPNKHALIIKKNYNSCSFPQMNDPVGSFDYLTSLELVEKEYASEEGLKNRKVLDISFITETGIKSTIPCYVNKKATLKEVFEQFKAKVGKPLDIAKYAFTQPRVSLDNTFPNMTIPADSLYVKELFLTEKRYACPGGLSVCALLGLLKMHNIASRPDTTAVSDSSLKDLLMDYFTIIDQIHTAELEKLSPELCTEFASALTQFKDSFNRCKDQIQKAQAQKTIGGMLFNSENAISSDSYIQLLQRDLDRMITEKPGYVMERNKRSILVNVKWLNLISQAIDLTPEAQKYVTAANAFLDTQKVAPNDNDRIFSFDELLKKANSISIKGSNSDSSSQDSTPNSPKPLDSNNPPDPAPQGSLWSSLSDTQKGLAVTGGIVVVGGITYILSNPKTRHRMIKKAQRVLAHFGLYSRKLTDELRDELLSKLFNLEAKRPQLDPAIYEDKLNDLLVGLSSEDRENLLKTVHMFVLPTLLQNSGNKG